ncbi:C6 zinc finger domain containing protein [Colletotrichum tofieldiae]|uniref:C6 zinc finger domain containing protein n=1 Tax=Colletotrichum tofieldiae TaxID=708197 RepID=A0A161VE80_9PEZI|nr:C6 zinc finger domain containing protein [Colletotrichum tofieldiae]
MSASLTSRSRLACAPCTRRKVKCSKTVPCTNCLRRGEEHSCTSDAIDNPRVTSTTSARPSSAQPRRSASPSTCAASIVEITYLRRKLSELENEARLNSLGSPRHHGSSSEYASPGPQSALSRFNTVQDDPRLERQSSSQIVVTDNASERTEVDDPTMKDAASILEFLAWGRRKDPEYHPIASPEATAIFAQGSEGSGIKEGDKDTMLGFNECSQLALVQLLLPDPRQVWDLVNYHVESLLWYHGSFFAATFRTQLAAFYAEHKGLVESEGVDLQWVSLLFSVLTASLVCAPSRRAHAWGFQDSERETLSMRWFEAMIICLNRADYTTNLNILSCQAIATATISAHPLGHSNSQSIYLAAAVRIAQSLGLHRLKYGVAGSNVEKETGRRVWCQLCSQDWFGIPFSESYLISPLYSTSDPPQNCHDHNLLPLPKDVPTITSYCRFLREIAVIMPQLQDGLMTNNTAYTRYKEVLTWDARLRTLATAERPNFLTNTPIETSWPIWVPWARQTLAISSSHKIIMIHRSFLSDSFTNPAFTFTRLTCIAASKTIIKEYKVVSQEDGPVLWVHQAFSVAASIILLLDVLHRTPGESEHLEHRQLAESVIEILGLYGNSTIATRGIKLLQALLIEVSNATSMRPVQWRSRKRPREDNDPCMTGGRHTAKFDVHRFVRGFCEANTANQSRKPENNRASPRLRGTPDGAFMFETAPSRHGDSRSHGSNTVESSLTDPTFSFPFGGLDSGNNFENLLYLANYDCFP